MKRKVKFFGVLALVAFVATTIYGLGVYMRVYNGESGYSISVVKEAWAQSKGKMPKDNIIDYL